MRTLRQLASRLNEIIAENDARRWSERNDLPAVIAIIKHTPTRKVRQTFYEVDYVSSAMHTIGGKHYCGLINGNDDREIKVNC